MIQDNFKDDFAFLIPIKTKKLQLNQKFKKNFFGSMNLNLLFVPESQRKMPELSQGNGFRKK